MVQVFGAVKNGKSADTSMGYTLIRRTNGYSLGTIDPAIVISLIEHDKYDASMLNELLNKQFMYRISGIRVILEILMKRTKGKKRAQLALIFSHKVKNISALMLQLYG